MKREKKEVARGTFRSEGNTNADGFGGKKRIYENSIVEVEDEP